VEHFQAKRTPVRVKNVKRQRDRAFSDQVDTGWSENALDDISRLVDYYRNNAFRMVWSGAFLSLPCRVDRIGNERG